MITCGKYYYIYNMITCDKYYYIYNNTKQKIIRDHVLVISHQTRLHQPAYNFSNNLVNLKQTFIDDITN